MIRLAVLLTVLTVITVPYLPKLRSELTRPFFQSCLQNVPSARHRSEIQSLVCGQSLHYSRQQNSKYNFRHRSSDEFKTSDVINSWRNLGLIHILVVSGGHLSILAALLGALTTTNTLSNTIFKRRVSFAIVAVTLILFSLGNQLQPPILRALIEWLGKKPLTRRGWRSAEIALASTWIALPWSQSIYDLLSLALAFFASVTVAETSRAFHRRRWLSLLALQVAVWWVLLPLLFTLGVPHPLSTMANVALAPILGATLIPLAMAAWASRFFPSFISTHDPLGLGFVFDFAWENISLGIVKLAEILPDASPRIPGTRPLIFGFEMTSVLLVAIVTASAALLIRTHRLRRREDLDRSPVPPLIFIICGLLLAVIVHKRLMA